MIIVWTLRMYHNIVQCQHKQISSLLKWPITVGHFVGFKTKSESLSHRFNYGYWTINRLAYHRDPSLMLNPVRLNRLSSYIYFYANILTLLLQLADSMLCFIQEHKNTKIQEHVLCKGPTRNVSHHGQMNAKVVSSFTALTTSLN